MVEKRHYIIPHLLKDVDKAVEIIVEGIAEKKAMRIIGDYDIDGVNATYILLDGIAGAAAMWMLQSRTG